MSDKLTSDERREARRLWESEATQYEMCRKFLPRYEATLAAVEAEVEKWKTLYGNRGQRVEELGRICEDKDKEINRLRKLCGEGAKYIDGKSKFPGFAAIAVSLRAASEGK